MNSPELKMHKKTLRRGFYKDKYGIVTMNSVW